MKTRIPLLLLALALAVTACAAETPSADDGSTPSTGDAAGLRLANGLYDQEDGTIIALGTLEWVDIEGGFYVLTGSPEGDGSIAVIANGDAYADELKALLGKMVQVTGDRSDGPTIRMSGPEIIIDSVVEISDTPGAAE